MEKKRLFRILSGAERSDVIAMGNSIQESHRITIIKKPEKSLAMIQMREPVKNSLFYIGETIVCEAVVSLDDVVGTAVTIGDDFDKVLNMAVIDAACNKGVLQNTIFSLSGKKIKFSKRNVKTLCSKRRKSTFTQWIRRLMNEYTS